MIEPALPPHAYWADPGRLAAGDAVIARIGTLRGAAGLPPARSPETDVQRHLVTGWQAGR